MAYLIINSHDGPPQRMKLTDNVLVGRAIGCDLWIDDIKLSRQHCRIEHDGEEWLLIDLNSTNGTLLNGQRINEVVLHEGDHFEAGRATIEFHEGDFIEHRPADPIEAASMGPGSLQRESAAEHSTLLGEEFPAARPNRKLPAPKVGQTSLDSSITLSSLPFTRPPARPIVKDDGSSPDDGVVQSSHWFQSLVSRLLRNGERP